MHYIDVDFMKAIPADMICVWSYKKWVLIEMFSKSKVYAKLAFLLNF